MQDETNTMYKLAEKLKELRDKKQDTEQQVKDITAELNAVEQELVAMMTETNRLYKYHSCKIPMRNEFH